MLILTRRKDERILIGNDITILVVKVSGDQVRLGIEAPADVVILRDDAKHKEPRHETSGS